MKKIIIANWKMNPSSAEKAEEIFNSIKKTAARLKKIEVVVCPPLVYLANFARKKSNLKLGAQDVFYNSGGLAHTGEVSPEMLINLGVKYVIIGHSERRTLGETNEIINAKIIAAFKAGLKIIFCVGEKERDANGKYFDFIRCQITEGLKGTKPDMLKSMIVAYEPSWAISGGGKLSPDKPESVFEVVLFIKKTLLPLAGDEMARKMPIIYGGSASAKTAGEFLAKGGVAGLLVGQKSLDAEEFGEILKIAEISK